MVRFHWQVDESCTAFVPVGGVSTPSERVQHISISLEVPAVAGYGSAVLTCLQGLANGAGTVQTKSVGVVLAHDADASSWKGELLSSLTLVRTGQPPPSLPAATAAAKPKQVTSVVQFVDAAACRLDEAPVPCAAVPPQTHIKRALRSPFKAKLPSCRRWRPKATPSCATIAT